MFRTLFGRRPQIAFRAAATMRKMQDQNIRRTMPTSMSLTLKGKR